MIPETAGVLALQGGYEPHLRVLASLLGDAREVRRPADLDGLTHLVLPGGESTTIAHLLRLFDLDRALVERYRAGTLSLFGTCAGAILLGGDDGTRPRRLGLLDAVCARNAYGRQIDSFVEALTIPALGPAPLPAVFIRAPKFSRVGPGAEVLASVHGDAVLVRGPRVLAATFHPELTDDVRLHRWFLDGMPAALRADSCRDREAAMS